MSPIDSFYTKFYLENIHYTKEDFDDNINFLGSLYYINNIFQSPLRELEKFLSNVMPIVISGFYIIINLYTIRSTKSVDVESIRQRRNSRFILISDIKIKSFIRNRKEEKNFVCLILEEIKYTISDDANKILY
ncbi:hypothetical protein H8356DRAFT_1349045 [Neocallimastix lanati (nom. inval.)]|nr:hypothetical protein H8356DRAFT_1349045 [Neocallimastix sp. JGI-2020a]